MSERDEKRGGLGCAITGVVLILLLVLYVLSIGPASWTAENYPATEQGLGLFYSPLLIISENFRPVGVVVDWYMDLWTG